MIGPVLMDHTRGFLVVGLLCVALGWPLVVGRVPPNRWYGLRTPRTLSDPRVWYQANRVMIVVAVLITSCQVSEKW